MPVTFNLIDAASLTDTPNLIADFNQAAAEWSAVLAGNVTINVEVDIATFPGQLGFLVEDSPYTLTKVGTAGSSNLLEQWGLYTLTTGNHVDPGGYDIQFTIGDGSTYAGGIRNIDFLANPADTSQAIGGYSAVSLFLKSIAYGLGFSTLTTTTSTVPGVTPLDAFVTSNPAAAAPDPSAVSPDVSGAIVLESPTAMAVYGGPVPLITPPGGYLEAIEHIGNTPTISGGADLMGTTQSLVGRNVGISLLDIAILEDAGVAITAQLFTVARTTITASSASFSITRPVSTSALTVYVSTIANQGSTDTSAFIPLVNSQISFAAGQSTATVAVALTGTIPPTAETFTLSVSASPGRLSVLGTASFTLAAAPISLPFGAGPIASIAQSLLAPYTLTSPTLQQVTSGGITSFAPGITALLDSAAAPATILGGAGAGQLVVAGTYGLAFNAGPGAGTVIAGGGNNLFSIYAGAGAQNIIAGSGADTVLALAGNNTIAAGAGNNLILAQGGNNQITSTGTDLIDLPTGSGTLVATNNSPTIFLGSGTSQVTTAGGQATIVAGAAPVVIDANGADQLWLQSGGGTVTARGAETIIAGSAAASITAPTGNSFIFAGSGPATLQAGAGSTTVLGTTTGALNLAGGSGSLLAITYANTTVTAGAGSSTIAAFGGSLTATGGAGPGVFLGGPAGNNSLTGGAGNTTLIGGGAGDTLAAGDGASETMQAGPGAETLLGGAGENLFAFAAATPGTDRIINFAPARDLITLLGMSATSALATAVTTGGSEQITLANGSVLTFQGFTGLTLANFS